jgi:hypothetical protein
MHILLNKKIIIIPITIIIAIFLMSFASDETSEKEQILFHVTLADPELYVNGVYTEIITLEKGKYYFRFVPNGSSPEILSIILNGNSLNFSEDFKLVGTPHQTGISKYFTWDYHGERNVLISETQEISVTIDPNGKTLGSVSVDILEN